MIIMLPILFPLVTGLGFDPVWFGIVMIVWLEMGFITPPVGINLFVIQGIARGSRMRDIAVGSTPFVVIMILLVVILFLVPDLALWLPRQMMGQRPASGRRARLARGRAVVVGGGAAPAIVAGRLASRSGLPMWSRIQRPSHHSSGVTEMPWIRTS